MVWDTERRAEAGVCLRCVLVRFDFLLSSPLRCAPKCFGGNYLKLVWDIVLQREERVMEACLCCVSSGRDLFGPSLMERRL